MYRVKLAAISAVAVALGLAAPAADAYRPPLAVAYPASDNRAWYECVNVIFPYDPYSHRCLTAGTLREPGHRHTCRSAGGRIGGAWCFIFAYATNNLRHVWRLWIKVSENCPTCYGYQSRVYDEAPL